MAEQVKLSGGVFFSILASGKKKGHVEGNTDPDLLAELIRFFDPGDSIKQLKQQTLNRYCSLFKKGEIEKGLGSLFGNHYLINEFHKNIQNSYGSLLSSMKVFAEKHMDKSSDCNTAKAILKCIEDDDSIADGQLFFSKTDGSTQTKKTLIEDDVICFEPLLLGVWDFILSTRPTETGKKADGTYKNIIVKRLNDWESSDNGETLPVEDEFSFSPWDQAGFEIEEWNEEIIQNIIKHRNLYVHTKEIDRVLKHLNKNRVSFLIGDPGSGKTFATEIVAYHFMKEGIAVICAYDYKDTDAILDHVRNEKDKKEIIIIDDCMGQAYFDLNSDQETSLRKLLAAILLCKCKFLLLNSRITIYNSARSSETGLARRLNEIHECILELQQPSELERATIYFKHLLYSDPIKNEHYLNLQPEKRYKNVINHKNYTPRLMEYVTSELFLRGTVPSEYYKNVMRTLANPSKIWDDEFNKKLEKKDRLLLTTLYSLSSDKVRADVCRIAYEKRISLESDIDLTRNNWEESVAVLNGSMVTRSLIDGIDYLTVSNPSVNDYLSSTIMKNRSSEWDAIARSFVSMSQLYRMKASSSRIDSILMEKGRDGSIVKLCYDSYEERCYYVALSVTLSGTMKKTYIDYVQECFRNEKCKRKEIFLFERRFRDDICKGLVKNDQLRDFYFPGKKLDSAINSLLENCSRYYISDFIELFTSLPVRRYDPSKPANKAAIFKAIDRLLEEYSGDCWEKINDVAEKYGFDSKRIAEDVDQDIRDSAYYDFPDADRVPEFITDYFNEQMEYHEFCSEDDVEQELNVHYDEPDQEYDGFYSDYDADSIAEMFERDSLK